MKSWAILIPAVSLYFLLVPSLAHYLTTEHQRIAIAFPTTKKVLKAVSLDQTLLIGEYMTLKVITFFGGRSNMDSKPLDKKDYYVMYRNLDVASALDPYNIDTYYFAQATLTWEVKEFAAANALLDYGMQYRTWDYYLPFFIAFNYSYFLKDPINAAKYYRKTADLTGNDLFMRLASRSLYESGKTDEAMLYLKTIIDTTKNQALQIMLKKRFTSLAAIRKIEIARDQFRAETGVLPKSIEQLVSANTLKEVPLDPYGGTFFIDEKGLVRTSSNMADGGKKGK